MTALTHSDTIIEQYSAHHHMEWVYNHQIVIVPSLGNPQRALVDDWAKMVKQIFDRWPSDRPMLLLADLSREVSPTPYQTAKSNEILSYRTDLKTYIAAVTEDNLSGQIARLSIRIRGRRNGEIQHFYSRDAGLEWLRKVGNIQPPV